MWLPGARVLKNVLYLALHKCGAPNYWHPLYRRWSELVTVAMRRDCPSLNSYWKLKVVDFQLIGPPLFTCDRFGLKHRNFCNKAVTVVPYVLHRTLRNKTTLVLVGA